MNDNEKNEMISQQAKQASSNSLTLGPTPNTKPKRKLRPKPRSRQEYTDLIHELLGAEGLPCLPVANTIYQRVHDDNDGTNKGQVQVFVDIMGDAYLMVQPPGGFTNALRFRTFGGGGCSLRVRNALIILAEAIRIENENDPEHDGRPRG